MFFVNRWSITRRSLFEWLSIGLALLVLSAYTAYSLSLDHDRTEAQEHERLISRAKILGDNLARQLQATNLALASVLREIPDWRRETFAVKRANQHLKALADAMPSVATMLLLDATGTVIASDKAELIGKNFAHREYFQDAKQHPNSETLYVSPPFMTALDHFTLNLSRMVPGRDGGFDGMIVAGLEPDDFKVLLKSVIHSDDMRASLIHGDGKLFTSVPKGEDFVGMDLSKSGSFFPAHLKSGRGLNVFEGNSIALGDHRMVAMLTIKDEALHMDKPLIIALGRDLNAIFATWRVDAIKTGGFVEIVSLLALLSLYFYQTRRRIDESNAAKREADRKQTVEALRVSEERFRHLTKLSSDWYWEQDEQFRFVRLSGKLDKRTSSANEGHMGKTRWEMGALNLGDADWNEHRAMLTAHQEFHDFQMQRRDREGKLVWISISGTPIYDAQGVFEGYRGIARDITAQKAAEEEIKRLAFYDVLTQLPNRRLFGDRLGYALAASNRSGRYGALMFLDLDNFKPLNDLHGHATGDLLLVEAGRRIASCVREVDTVARFGGDEFAVILSELDTEHPPSRAKAANIAEKIHTALAAPYEIAPPAANCDDSVVVHHCSASIGVTLFIGHATPQREILKAADMAMYQAKADGRNLIRFFESGDSAATP